MIQLHTQWSIMFILSSFFSKMSTEQKAQGLIIYNFSVIIIPYQIRMRGLTFGKYDSLDRSKSNNSSCNSLELFNLYRARNFKVKIQCLMSNHNNRLCYCFKECINLQIKFMMAAQNKDQITNHFWNFKNFPLQC